MNDLISIIIPLYNNEKYFKTCIESVMKQTYKNIEIIVINDGSTDKSFEIAKEYETMDKRIKLINKNNSGVSDTRNIGVDISKGKYIIFIDSDDWIELNTIEIMYNYIIKNSVDIVRCNTKRFTTSKKYIIDRIPSDILNKKIDIKQDKSILNYLFDSKKRINCYSPLLLINRNIIPKFNTKLFCMEDVAFYIELFINANSIYFINNELYNYRYNENSSSKNYKNVKNNIEGIIDSMNYIINILNSKGINDDNLISNIYINYFNIIISKLDILINSKNTDLLKKINDDLLIDVIKSVKYSKLNMIKKLEFILLKNQKIKSFVLLEKIKLKIK